ncbi:MAG: CHAP domain-containing protein [Firmicutes bacterium]|nr:CHAP domain-containing protein [Bacillota bacterium]
MDINDVVEFNGTADAGVVKVELFADEKFSIGVGEVKDGKWSVKRRFSVSGTRQIIAYDIDSAGRKTRSAGIGIKLNRGKTEAILAIAEVEYKRHIFEGSDRVASYLAAAGVNDPTGTTAWCASFVYWCIKKACGGSTIYGAEVPNLAYVPSIYGWAKSKGILTVKPERGHLFISMDGTSEPWHHIGFVAGVDENEFYTIEGNSGYGGSTDHVAEVPRNISGDGNDTYIFVDISTVV